MQVLRTKKPCPKCAISDGCAFRAWLFYFCGAWMLYGFYILRNEGDIANDK